MAAMLADRHTAWRWAGIALVAILLLFAIERIGWQDGRFGLAERRAASSPGSSSSLPRSYREALARLDLTIADARARADSGADHWLLHEALAYHYLARARLSGSYDDYAAAQAALDRAFRVAVAGSGPHLLRARLDFNMHRLAAAERQLAGTDLYAVPPNAAERADIAAMRGDIAFYRGQFSAAGGHYDEADRLAPGTASFRRAIQSSRFGQIAQSEALFDRSEQGQSAPLPQDRAYFELQRGILDLDRERLDDALGHFRRADEIFPGHWLIEEHIAEVTTLKGDLPAAELMYRDIVRRTGHPEFMDALAQIAVQRGDARAAKHWFDRAGTIWARRLRSFPEASYGHAIDHCVARGDWPCALSLARRNHQARPYGDAKVALARALFGSGRAEEARAMIETLLASPWRTSELHRTAAEIFAATGDPAMAAEQRRLVQRLRDL